MPKQAIVVCSWPGGKESLQVLLDSMHDIPYPIYLAFNDGPAVDSIWLIRLEQAGYNILLQEHDGFELGTISLILAQTDLDEFILLQDTIEIKNSDIFRILFDNYPNQSVSYNPHFQMYLGKYRREILSQMNIPHVTNKVGAVQQEEVFHKEYRQREPTTAIFNHNFVDEQYHNNPKEERFGRLNLVLHDEYIIKRKGTWSVDQL